MSEGTMNDTGRAEPKPVNLKRLVEALGDDWGAQAVADEAARVAEARRA